MLSIKQHNVMDYVTGATLIAAPELSGLKEVPRARGLFWALGFGLIGYSLLTRYPYSLKKVIPLGMHMAMDVASGLTLMAGPSLLGYQREISGFQRALHFILGGSAIGLVALTKPRTEAGQIVSQPTPAEWDRMRMSEAGVIGDKIGTFH